MSNTQELEAITRLLDNAQRRRDEAAHELAELQEQHQAILAAEVERKHLAELETPREIRVRSFDGTNVNVAILPSIRPDIFEIIRASPGRVWNTYTQVNSFHIDAWAGVRDKLVALPHIKLTHLLGVEEAIKKALTGTEFTISLHEKFLRIEFHPKAISGVLLNVPGMRWLAEKHQATVPLSEGWRLIDIFDNYTRQGTKREIIWDKKALELVQSELEKRVQLDRIVMEKDAELPNPFQNGHLLKPFQKVGVKFMHLADGKMLLADQMGLGKTWQAVAYALTENLRTVVICPAHLKANWAREIYNLTGQLPVMLRGREPDQIAMAQMLVEAEKKQFTILNYDILGFKTIQPMRDITNADGSITRIPEKFRYLWSELINMSRPDLVILDEAHYIKNTSANRTKAIGAIQAPHRLPMTGTPILNRIGEYASVLHWIRPDLFPSVERFIADYTSDGRAPKNVAALRDILKPIMLRRLKKDVVADLPPLNRITQVHELSDDAINEYKLVLAGVYRAIDKAGNEIAKNVTGILVEIGKLKEVCARDKVQHTAELAIELYETEQDAADPKMGRNKVLIFSQYKEPVRMIAKQLGDSAIYWTGDTPQEKRNELEKQFQTNPNIKFLVVSLMTGQTGLNLTAAGHVIFNDLYWTPAAHAQAEERAYGRLSDMHGADSYYIVAQNTIEDWIQELLLGKLALITEVVEGIDAERDVSVAMTIINRLKEERGKMK